LGVDPGPDLIDLHMQILRRDPGLDLAPAGSATSDTGSPDNGPPVPRPVQLPAPVGHFTGRVPELTALDQLVGDRRGDTRIAVITGPAGMGKTALAVQWAHRVADRFPDGQLFVDLRGHDRRTSLSPSAALSHLLRSLGVPAERLPAELTEQVGLYRSLLHDKRILVVLDDGGRTDDILPLIPPGAGNRVVVTSRNVMSGLATYHAVCPVGVDVLGEAEALALLEKVLGAGVVEGDPAGAVELARLCGGMPLALRIAAAKLASHPQQTIRELTYDLARTDRLDALTVDDDSRSVRAVFASAYRALSTPTARVFRLLGLHPGHTFTPDIAAALAGLPLTVARQAVEELVTANLATRTGGDRCRFHDLIQLFAYRCASADEPAEQQQVAVARLIDWYLTVVDAANRAGHPGRDRVSPTPRYRPAELPFAMDNHAALAFLNDERANLLSIVRYAAEHAHEEAAWQLTYLLTGFYDSRGHRDERVEMCRWGVTAACATADRAAEGLMRSGLGVAYIAARRFDQALESLNEALPLMRACGDRRGEGHVYNNIAVACSSLRRFDEAVEALKLALAIHSRNGYRLGVVLALNNTGHTYVRMGRPELSFQDLTQALDIVREIGNPRLEAATLHSLGDADMACDDPDGALDHFGQALLICRQIGDRRDEAATLNSLGVVHLRRGDHAAALEHLREAAALAGEIGDRHLEAIALNNIGRAHLMAGELRAARRQLQLALALRVRIPDAYEEAHLHRNLSDLEERSGNPEGVKYHRGLAVRLYEKVNATDEAGRLATR
jgi:tetratricopeptide (TPR) repeat protein